MSELKVIDLGNIRESIENDESVYYEYYAKSEADKVIAEKDKDIEKLKSDISDLRDDKKLTDSILVECNTEIAELKTENERLKEERRWRNCSEELPEKDKYVLAFCPNLKSIEIARILDDEWRDFSWNYLEVTHWMPIPLAPKEKE